MENESLADVAPVADGPQVMYEHQEEQHECHAGKRMNGADQEHHDQAAQEAQSAGVPSKTTERGSKTTKTGFNVRVLTF